MGRSFYWFKEATIKGSEYNSYGMWGDFKLVLSGGDSTSHSYGNVGRLQDVFEKNTGKTIPYLPYEDFIDTQYYDLGLINPVEMSKLCKKVLKGKEIDQIHMRDRVEWFKKLSDEGYYLAYDYE